MSGNLAIEPFAVDVDDTVLDDLRARLRNTRFPAQLPDAGWDYGTEREYLRELVTYWADEYDWPARQARMNAFDHFRTEIDGTGVHFLHAPSPVEGALPLLLTHGWPGSVAEFLDVIEPLRDPARARRRSRRRVPRRGGEPARVRVLGPDGRARVAPRSHRARVGAAHGRSRLRPLRGAGW